MRVPARLLYLLRLAMALGMATLSTSACKPRDRRQLASFTRPRLPAGFVEATGSGWKVAVPATWAPSPRERAGSWVYADPQPVDDYRANVSVLTEPFDGESLEYAKATADALRGDARASVVTPRDDVIDGDPTLVIEARWTPIGPAGAAFHTMQADLASRGTGYVITCAASASAFERYRSTCDAIVRSFAVQR